MIKILITSIGSAASQGVIKSLNRSDFYIVGIDANSRNSYSTFVNEFYVIDSALNDNYLQSLMKLCTDLKIELIIPIMEIEILLLAENQKKFNEKNIKILTSNYNLIESFTSKSSCIQLFKKIGLNTPRIYTSTKYKFPFIVKPIFGTGSKGIIKIENSKDYEYFQKDITNENNIIQEYVIGTEYSFDCFSDKDGEVLGIIPRLRIDIRNGLCYKSKTVFDKEELINLTNKLNTLKLIGPYNIQAIRHDLNGKYYFFELNPRFGGTYVLSVKAGLDINQYIVDFLNDQKSMKLKKYKEIFMTRRLEESYFTEIN